MEISIPVADDSLAEVAQIERGERAIVRVARNAEIGDIVYRQFHFQEVGEFLKVAGRRKGLLVLESLADGIGGTCVPWRCTVFGVVIGGDAFADFEEIPLAQSLAA